MRYSINNLCLAKVAYSLIKSLCLFYIVYLVLFLSYINYNGFNDLFDKNSPMQHHTKVDFKVTEVHKLTAKRKDWNKCNLESNECFDTYRCQDSIGLKVYIYDNSVDGHFSKEFKEVIKTITSSQFYENDPSKACLFMPLIDFLNENSLDSQIVNTQLINLD